MRRVCWGVVVLLLSITCYSYLCQGLCLQEERTALLHIKQSINFPYGSSLSYWDSHDCCQWEGVTCNSLTSRVIQIDLSSTRKAMLGLWYPNATVFAQFKELEVLYLLGNQIGGWDMPQELCNMRNLRTLILDHNNITQLPPCLGSMSSLRKLALGFNNIVELVSIEVLCGLRKLEDLDLSGNYLIQLPRCLGNMSSLIILNLGYNNLRELVSLEGLCTLNNLQGLVLWQNSLIRLPRCLWNMSSLTGLSLGDNYLTESVSLEGLCGLKNLNSIDISYNKLGGIVPSCISNLTSLLYLDLSNNKFEGHLSFSMFANHSQLVKNDLSNNPALMVDTEHPSSWYPSFQLLYLNMSNCNLNKHADSQFPSFLFTQNIIQVIDLSNNGLLGDIPSWFFHNKSSLQWVRLGNNSLHGLLPLSFSPNTSELMLLDISHNQIQGLIPTNIRLLLPNLKFLNMSNNVLQGSVPSSFGYIIGLDVLDLSNNNFSGEIPNQLTSNMTSLRYLDLSRNALEGKMLPLHSNMPNLKFLYLNDNRFTGEITSSLSNSSPLLTILDISNNYMSGSIPMWLPAQVSALILKGNHFRGHIPDHLCKMQNLHILDLSHNNISGTIPSCFNNITTWKTRSPVDVRYRTSYIPVGRGIVCPSKIETLLTVAFMTKGNLYSYKGGVLSWMTGIDVSANQLTGNIPPELGYLKELHGLNLSHNSLAGPIPQSFQSLEQLESLDLSFNQLNGTIPSTLNQLHFMSRFNVAHNQLSGRLPDYKGQFATFNESSYEGNPGLCGEPLKNRCDVPSNGTGDVEEDDEDSPFLYYSFIALSYVLGFWASFGLLMFKKSWRRNYFKAIDGCFDFCVERRHHGRPQQNRRR